MENKPRYPSRPPIPTSVRRAVIERDGHMCQHCGAAVAPRQRGSAGSDTELHLDHLKFWVSGGEHTIDNLVVSCRACNLSRQPNGRDRARRRKQLPIPYVGYRSGSYVWSGGFVPPKILPPERMGIALVDAVDKGLDKERRNRRMRRLLSRIAGGEVAATHPDEGAVYVEYPIPPEKANR